MYCHQYTAVSDGGEFVITGLLEIVTTGQYWVILHNYNTIKTTLQPPGEEL
jgi:hypothetical protein